MYSYISHIVPIIISVIKDNNNYNVNMESNKEIISKLKFIGRLQKGEKINVKYMYVQQDGFSTMISRTLINQDNRSNTLNFIQNTINRAFELISVYEKSETKADKITCINIINDLKKAKIGMINLKETYLLDIMFGCNMDTLLQSIDAKLTDIQDKFPLTEIKSE
jgi:septation ring formation regulator EzrA